MLRYIHSGIKWKVLDPIRMLKVTLPFDFHCTQETKTHTVTCGLILSKVNIGNLCVPSSEISHTHTKVY